MNEHERLLYQGNKRSQSLIMIYLLGNTIITIFYVNSMNLEVQLGMVVLLNIALSLIAFLMAVRQAAYSMEWGIGGIVLGLFQIGRILWMPEEITGSVEILMIVLFIVTGVSALLASYQCIKLSRERTNFIVENNVDLSTLQK